MPSSSRISPGVGAVGLSVALALLAFAHAVAAWSSDPAGRSSMLGTFGLVTASLATLGCSAWWLVTSTRSPSRRVFCGRRLLMCAVALIAIAGALIASLMIRDPFHEFAAAGRFTSYEFADLGCILGAVVCMTVGGAAILDAYEAVRDERHWGRSLGIGP